MIFLILSVNLRRAKFGKVYFFERLDTATYLDRSIVRLYAFVKMVNSIV